MSALAGGHPRIRARRERLRRDLERRRWIRWGVVTGVVVSAAGLLAIARSPLTDVDRVDIVGLERVDERQVLAQIGAIDEVQLVDVDLRSLERRVERLPWVADAVARRQWPATIAVDITERSPVAAVAIGAAGPYALLDLDGHVVDVVEAQPTLPFVRGDVATITPGLVARGLEAAVRVVDAIPADLAAWVVAVEQHEAGDVDLVLVDDVRAKLGTPEQLADKLVALATLLTRVQTDCIVGFDVQAPDAPVLTRCPAPRRATAQS